MTAYTRYRIELAKLRALASRRDFSATGDARYYAQYCIVKQAQHTACLAAAAQCRKVM